MSLAGSVARYAIANGGDVMPSERSLVMARLYAEEGLTLAEIGERYGITRERVRQILKPFGLEAHYGKKQREQRARLVRQAHERVIARESTVREEAENLGYMCPSSLYSRFWLMGLSLPSRTPEHGTPQRYRSGKCRCDLCRAANTARMKEMRQARTASQHGVASSYFNFGCRCPECRAAGRTYRRELKARQRQKKQVIE